jgi:hypothetical protein
MTPHRYILEPYKGMNTRYRCPGCQRPEKTFSRYIDTQTGQYIDPAVGRCSREINCGYHYTPKQYFQDNNLSIDTREPKLYPKPSKVAIQSKPVSYIDAEIFKASLRSYDANYFVQFLIGLFGTKITKQLIETYIIGTSKHWPGATVFWQIDLQGKIRTGKIMQYSLATGRRVKEHITWVHAALKMPEFELKQCLFGEHLLQDRSKPLALVESEKTAIIASVYLPQFIWLAVGSLTNLTAAKCSILKGRSVILYPDIKCFEKWSKKAKELSHLASFQVSDLLERHASESDREQGLDLADYLIRFDYREFLAQTPAPVQIEQTPPVQTIVRTEHKEPIEPDQYIKKAKIKSPDLRERDFAYLVQYFETATLPKHPFKLNNWTTVNNVSTFIETNLIRVRECSDIGLISESMNSLREIADYLSL